MKLSLRDFSFSYGERLILDHISFDVEGGEMFSLLGANGIGKTTLFQCILGNLSGYTGTIEVDGEDVRKLSSRERSAVFAYIPQIRQQTFSYPVLDMVLMGATRRLSVFDRPGKDEAEIAMESLSLMGIADLKDRDFKQLSGGEQQLVLIARALTQQAQILIMDEPTSSLDYGNQHRVLERVRGLTKNGYTIMLSTHNPQHALTFADHVLALCDKKIAADGKPEQVLTQSLMRTLYRIEVSFFDTEWGRVFVPHGEAKTEETGEIKKQKRGEV